VAIVIESATRGAPAGSRGITKPEACLGTTAMRFKLAAMSALAAAALVMALFAERRTRPTLADEHGD